MLVYKTPLRINLIAGLLVGIVLLALAPLSLRAQPPTEQYFPETGHTVRGEFLDYFNTHGGLRIFGFPITEEFLLNGRTVQYFQRVRMELYPENPAAQRVKLGPLGKNSANGSRRSQRLDPILISSGIFRKQAIL
jgi:hypothetical protein